MRGWVSWGRWVVLCACWARLSLFSMRRQTSRSRQLMRFSTMLSSQVCSPLGLFLFRFNFDLVRWLTSLGRVPYLLRRRSDLFDVYDIPSGASVWEEESSDLHLDLLNSWLRLRHVGESFRYCAETYHRRQQPIHPCLDLRLPHRYRFLHSHANELHQQGIESILNIHVSGQQHGQAGRQC